MIVRIRDRHPQHDVPSVLFLLLIFLLVLPNCHARNNNNTATTQRQLLRASPRIVGGTPAEKGAYPGFIYWNQGCGATLITNQIALTAAHCYLGNPGMVYVGSIERSRGQTFAVEHVRIHPRFNGNRDDPDWDYMILKLKNPVPASLATPVTLNQNPHVPLDAGDAVVAIGFGRLREGGKSDSDTLQQVTLPYVPNHLCSQVYGSGRIHEAAVCAGMTGLDACQGDSGGPLFAANDDGAQLQVGIVSWGYGCARPNYPGVYARVSTGFPWIQAQACLQSDNAPHDFCSGAAVPLGLTLEMDLVLDHPNYAWGLYAVHEQTTLYESKFDHGTTTVSINTATITTTGRKKEDYSIIIDDPNAVHLKWDNVVPGMYYFTLHNPLGTGLSSADSHVWIQQGDRRRVVTVPHNFGSTFTHYFNVTDQHLVTDIRQQQLDPLSPPVTVELMIDVLYDAHPNETAWELRNLYTDEVLGFISVGSITESKYESYLYRVERGQQYQVRIWDNTGNGLTMGWMSVWIGHEMIWKSDQDNNTTVPFTFEATKVFDV